MKYLRIAQVGTVENEVRYITFNGREPVFVKFVTWKLRHCKCSFSLARTSLFCVYCGIVWY